MWSKYFVIPKHFYILIVNEKVLVLCEKWLSKFSSNVHVLRSPEWEKTVFTTVYVCLSVVVVVVCQRDNFWKNHQIGLRFVTLLQIPKRKDEFVITSHFLPTFIVLSIKSGFYKIKKFIFRQNYVIRKKC